jgi:hypothetical protein
LPAETFKDLEKLYRRLTGSELPKTAVEDLDAKA